MMLNKFLITSLSLCTLQISMPTFAQSESKPQTQSTNTPRSSKLSDTEQRLEKLIKAAAAQNLVGVRRQRPDTRTAEQPPARPVKTVNPQKCPTKNLYSFPQESHIKNYEDILALKKQMFTEPEKVDPHISRILTQAYLGIGFGEEAMDIATHLNSAEQAMATAMVNVLRSTHTNAHKKTLKENASCSAAAKIWYKLASQNYEMFTDADFVDLNKLPQQLGLTMGLRFALKAIQNNDLKSAQLLYDHIQSNIENKDGYDPALSPYLQNDSITLLDALLAVNNGNVNEHNRGIAILNSLAEREGLTRAQAIQALSKSDELYPEYEQDLDSVTQTFSQTPSGQRAKVQKINFLAKQHKLSNAISLTKDSFDPHSQYFDQSVRAISREMQIDLSSPNPNFQLAALDAFIAEGNFFAKLDDEKPLQIAGVKASLDLGLADFAPTILSTPYWKNLDDATLTHLALQHVKPKTYHFPKQIMESPSLRALNLRKALDNKNPKQALKILNENPNSVERQIAFKQAAWENGYWSLAHAELDKNPNTNIVYNQKLASTLSALSPVLIKSHRPSKLADQQALQSHLESDLKIFRSYLLSKAPAATGAKNG